MDDTPEAVKELFHNMLMARTPSERARMGSDMHAAAKRIVLSSLPKGLSAGERMRAFFLRFYEGDFDAATAKKILDSTGVDGGIVVHLGCGDGRLTTALRANDRYTVHGLDAAVQNSL